MNCGFMPDHDQDLNIKPFQTLPILGAKSASSLRRGGRRIFLC